MFFFLDFPFSRFNFTLKTKKDAFFNIFHNLVDLTLCHDLKNLVQEFYRLDLVVITNDRLNNENDLCNNPATDVQTPSTPPASNFNPSTFINTQANRIKSKLNLPINSSPKSGQPVLSTTWIMLRNNLSILANAAAIELYFLCVEDEQDAEKLCTKCSEKFFLNLSLTETIAQAPLIASCVQVLGRLALKYPNLSKISVRHLTDFLTEPSPILFKQYKHIIEKLNTFKPSLTPARKGTNRNGDNQYQTGHHKTLSAVVNGNITQNLSSISRNQTISYKAGNVSFSKSTRIFEFLRDSTIECLCLSLNSCYNVDKDCIKAVCTKLASRLCIADVLDRYFNIF